MKKLGVVLVIVVVAVFLVPIVASKLSKSQRGTETPSGRGDTGTARSREIEPAEPVSAEMSQWLNWGPKSMTFTAPVDIREITVQWAEIAPVAVNNPQFVLSFTIDPEVTATVTGQWRRAPMRKVLDDVCRSNNLQWQVVGSSAIRISVRQ